MPLAIVVVGMSKLTFNSIPKTIPKKIKNKIFH